MASNTSQTKAAVEVNPLTFPINIEQLRKFHDAHFPGQEVPNISANDEHEGTQQDEEQDDLGYYADGVKRTLTDEQVKLFRHTEIQRLLSERRQARAEKVDQEARKRRKEKHIARPPRFDDEPGKDKVEFLMYDDESHVEQAQRHSAQGKFLWPTLGV